MSDNQLEAIINLAWDNRDSIDIQTKGEYREAVENALESMDSGVERVASPLGNHKWKVNQWLKKAVLLSFRLNDMTAISGGPGDRRRVWGCSYAKLCKYRCLCR
jgi:2,3,4,5-tetrahydropyridine-2-carboxylate N-succinyltransferase